MFLSALLVVEVDFVTCSVLKIKGKCLIIFSLEQTSRSRLQSNDKHPYVNPPPPTTTTIAHQLVP